MTGIRWGPVNMLVWLGARLCAICLVAGLLIGHAAPAVAGEAAERARQIYDSRPWAATVYVGTSVVDGYLRELIVNPGQGSYGDDTVFGGGINYNLARFWRFFSVSVEGGALYRFGQTEGGEFWANIGVSYDGFPWTDYLYTTLGVFIGPDVVTRLPAVERGTAAQPEPYSSNLLNNLSPEITFALPSSPQNAVVIRYMHRSGVFGGINNVTEGANTLTAGFRYRF